MSGPFVRIYEQMDSYATISLNHVRRADCQNLKGPPDERRVVFILARDRLRASRHGRRARDSRAGAAHAAPQRPTASRRTGTGGGRR